MPRADFSPFVACSIGVLHRKRPIVGVIAQPFLGRIVCRSLPWYHRDTADWQFSARLGGGAFMNRTTPLPLTGGIPQPLDKLSDCIFSAECEYRWSSWTDWDSYQGDRIGRQKS